MGADPSEIREGIATTREQLGDTINELAARVDVKGRAKHWAEEKRETISDRLSSVNPAPYPADGRKQMLIAAVALLAAFLLIRRIARRS
jgi:Protein of unknown function (DUF3618)